MTFRDASKQDYQALLLVLEKGYGRIERNGLDARAQKNAVNEQLSRIALTVFLEAVLQALNTHVDGAIAAAAMTLAEGSATVAMTREQRESRLGKIEERFGFSRGALPGWDAAKKTNDQTSALKHRLGLTFRTGVQSGLAIEESVDLGRDELLARSDDVEEWVEAFANKVGL